jgi:hypothetical protein
MFPFEYVGYAYYIIPILQVICILHLLKTNRSRDWLWLLIFLPFIGCIIYFVREVYPSLGRSGINAQQIGSLFPKQRIKKLEHNLRIADTQANRLLLAEEHARQGNFKEALQLAKASINILNADNPEMLLIIARYCFGAGAYEESLNYLQQAFILKNNRFDRVEDELLLAKNYHQLAKLEDAKLQYAKIAKVHHSLEARYQLGLLLAQSREIESAKQEFTQLIADFKLHPKHVRRKNTQWYSAAQRALSNLR